ncbi:MAG TPA: YbhB/YbcL family Raf kinase inhibitor-like protein [Polyangia bacterium]
MFQTARSRIGITVFSLSLLTAFGCSSSDNPPPSTSNGGAGGRSGGAGGGTAGRGGAGGSSSGQGGSTASGGSTGSGGSSASGGSTGSGGASGTGGSTSDAGRDGAGDASADGGDASRPETGSDGGADAVTGALTITAPWPEGGNIPNDHACPANNWPKISWTPGPAGTLSYAFALHDNDFDTHYVILDIPATVTSLPPVPAGTRVPKMGFATVNDMKWGGPCPPSGTHTYTLSVYALKTDKYVGAATSAPAVRTNLERMGNADVLAKAKYTGRRASN